VSTNQIPTPEATEPAHGGIKRLRRQVGVLRALTVVSLVLVLVLAVWSVVGIVSLSSQVSSLEAKIDSLSALASEGRTAAGGSAGDATTPSAQAAPAPDRRKASAGSTRS
jgi:hypothetical protein